MREALADRNARARHVTDVELGRSAQQGADGLGEQLRVVRGARELHRDAAQLGRERRRPVPVADLHGQPLVHPAGGRAVARVLEHPREQLVGRLLGRHVESVLLVARQHHARLELEQRRDQHEELGRGLQVQLASGLEVVDVGQDDLGQVDLEQVHLLAQYEREQQIERPLEDLQVEIERCQLHPAPG